MFGVRHQPRPPLVIDPVGGVGHGVDDVGDGIQLAREDAARHRGRVVGVEHYFRGVSPEAFLSAHIGGIAGRGAFTYVLPVPG